LVRVGDLVVDFRSYDAHKGDERLTLTPKEFGLLRALVARAGSVVTRDELLDDVWGYEANPTTRTVDNHVASLRAAIEPDPSKPCYLLTVHGVGYKWAGAAEPDTNP
jgi:DNA-binding response OmpR family regulator